MYFWAFSMDYEDPPPHSPLSASKSGRDFLYGPWGMFGGENDDTKLTPPPRKVSRCCFSFVCVLSKKRLQGEREIASHRSLHEYSLLVKRSDITHTTALSLCKQSPVQFSFCFHWDCRHGRVVRQGIRIMRFAAKVGLLASRAGGTCSRVDVHQLASGNPGHGMGPFADPL